MPSVQVGEGAAVADERVARTGVAEAAWGESVPVRAVRRAVLPVWLAFAREGATGNKLE
jgi:hypothetical protein